MSDPVFKVGDRVECEMSSWTDCRPRWDDKTDNGGTGKIITGTVKSFNAYSNICGGPTMEIQFDPPAEHWDNWIYIMPGHKDYDPNQWGRPGFLRHSSVGYSLKNIVFNFSDLDGKDIYVPTQKIQPVNKIQQLQKKFLGKTNTMGCECGAWTDGGPHSSWCKCA
jgi:hypothetical protein